MTELEALQKLLDEVKQKIKMLDAIEARLIHMRELVMQSTDQEILKFQRIEIQKEISNLIDEIKLLEMNQTIDQ